MKKGLLMTLLAGCASPRPAPESLREAVLSALRPAGGEWSIYFKDLQSGLELAVRADEEFHPASTLKIWVMIKVYQDVREGKYSLDDGVSVETQFPSAAQKDPQPFLVEPTAKAVKAAIGGQMSVRDLVEYMITLSDNVATNLLIRKAGGPEAITDCIRSWGAARSTVRRYIMDQQAFDEGLSSRAFARDFGTVLERLARGGVVNPAASQEMLGVLSRLKDNEMLPRQLPRKARVAHKTGALEGVRADVGLVTLPDGRSYVAAFFARGLKDAKEGERCLAAASRVLYEAVSH